MAKQSILVFAAVFYILVGILTVAFRAGPIEADLSARVAEALAETKTGSAWATISFSGRDATLKGVAPDQEVREEVLNVIDGVRGVRKIADETSLLPLSSPYTLMISNGDELVLRGDAPDEKTLQALKQNARSVYTKPIRDELKLARGAPSGNWLGAATVALTQIRELRSGMAVLRDNDLTISGATSDPKMVGMIEKAMRGALPSGFSGRVKVTETMAPVEMDQGTPEEPEASEAPATPDVSAISQEPEAAPEASPETVPAPQETPEVKEVVESEDAPEPEDEVGNAEPDLQAPSSEPDEVSASEPAEVAPEGDPAQEVPQELLDYDDSIPPGADIKEADIKEPDIETEDASPPDETADQESDSVSDVAKEEAVVPTFTLHSCNDQLADVTSGQAVQFEAASAVLKPRPSPLLDAIAELAKGCDGARLVVLAHPGESEAANALNGRRGKAVVRYLVSRGLPEGNVEMVANHPVSEGSGVATQQNIISFVIVNDDKDD
ncbi:MAG: BON domain-containing protein [Pseudomonadota bacterium]